MTSLIADIDLGRQANLLGSVIACHVKITVANVAV
jgi:hypothetical protein